MKVGKKFFLNYPFLFSDNSAPYLHLQKRCHLLVDILTKRRSQSRTCYQTAQRDAVASGHGICGHHYVDLKSVYEPTTGWVPGQWPPIRKVVNITIPSKC